MTPREPDLTLTITLSRAGGPGGDWRAVLDRDELADVVTVDGPMPGTVLGELGEDLDTAELAAIAAMQANR